MKSRAKNNDSKQSWKLSILCDDLTESREQPMILRVWLVLAWKVTGWMP